MAAIVGDPLRRPQELRHGDERERPLRELAHRAPPRQGALHRDGAFETRLGEGDG
jgi:hypothetical protein